MDDILTKTFEKLTEIQTQLSGIEKIIEDVIEFQQTQTSMNTEITKSMKTQDGSLNKMVDGYQDLSLLVLAMKAEFEKQGIELDLETIRKLRERLH